MKESNQHSAEKLLKPYRQQIDALDEQILKLLGKRFDLVRKVARIKIKHDIPSFLYGRVMEVRDRCVKLGKYYGIEPSFVHLLYSAIIYQSCGLEDSLKEKSKKK